MTEALLSKGEALERRLGSGNEPTKEERDSFAHEEEQWRQAVSAALNYYKEHSLDEARAVLDELLNSEKYGGRLAQIRVHLGL